LYHTTIGLRVIKKKEEEFRVSSAGFTVQRLAFSVSSAGVRFQASGFTVQDVGFRV